MRRRKSSKHVKSVAFDVPLLLLSIPLNKKTLSPESPSSRQPQFAKCLSLFFIALLQNTEQKELDPSKEDDKVEKDVEQAPLEKIESGDPPLTTEEKVL